MSRITKITHEYKNFCQYKFEEMLDDNSVNCNSSKLTNGEFEFRKNFSLPDKRATLTLSLIAWAKMTELVRWYDDEVAWHGICHRGEENEYIVTDIIVYPQTVTGVTVEMDTEMYASWLMKNDGDKRFDNIRMQGHSHVDMDTTPSGVDISHQLEIINMMGDDDFYIFTIWNKAHSNWTTICDLQKNIMFESSDIDIRVNGLDGFIQETKELVKVKQSPISYLSYDTRRWKE